MTDADLEELCLEYMDREQLDELIAAQRSDWVRIGAALVAGGHLTRDQVEERLVDFQEKPGCTRVPTSRCSVGIPGGDEVDLLPKVAKIVSETVDVPLCLDSANPDALAAALEVFLVALW